MLGQVAFRCIMAKIILRLTFWNYGKACNTYRQTKEGNGAQETVYHYIAKLLHYIIENDIKSENIKNMDENSFLLPVMNVDML